jgi:hypothetical protein
LEEEAEIPVRVNGITVLLEPRQHFTDADHRHVPRGRSLKSEVVISLGNFQEVAVSTQDRGARIALAHAPAVPPHS